MTVAVLILTPILTFTGDIDSIMPKLAGVKDHLNLSDDVLASTETFQSDAGGKGSSYEWQGLICPACEKRFDEYQNLERHFQSSHLPCSIFCPYSAEGCRWRGVRMDDFEKHLDTQKCGPKPEEQQYRIYDVKLILSWVKNTKSSGDISIAQNLAVDLVKERALELGRQEWLEDPWGLSPETQARRHRA